MPQAPLERLTALGFQLDSRVQRLLSAGQCAGPNQTAFNFSPSSRELAGNVLNGGKIGAVVVGAGRLGAVLVASAFLTAPGGAVLFALPAVCALGGEVVMDWPAAVS